MAPKKPLSSKATTLFSLLIIYIISSLTILLFIVNILRRGNKEIRIIEIISGSFILLLPLVLIALFIINVIRLLNERSKKVSGSRLKLKLAFMAIFIVFLASVPQGLLLLLTDYVMVESWYSAKFNIAIHKGVENSVLYYQTKTNDLLAIAEYDLPDLLKINNFKPQLVLNKISKRYPDIVGLEIYNPNTGEDNFAGDENARLSTTDYLDSTEGILPRETNNSDYFQKYAKHIYLSDNSKRIAVLSLKIDPTFEENAILLSEAQRESEQLLSFRPYFKFIIFGAYLIIALPLLLIAILAAFSIADIIMIPVDNLTAAIKKVANGDIHIRVPSNRHDELSILTDNFNKMLRKLETSRFEEIETEKITVWQDIAQRLAHEIKNPLTPIKLSAERILRRYHNDENSVNEILEKAMISIIQQVDSLTSLLQDFRSFAKLPLPQFEWTNLHNLIVETIDIWKSSHPKIVIETYLPKEQLIIRLDINHIKQVLTNIISNAIDAMNGEGLLIIKVNEISKNGINYCRLMIIDNGIGISEESQAKIFTPYFTTKSTGTGLGLSIVRHIILEHKGEIHFESSEGKGCTFIIDLPEK